jgi:hypothetical protein
MEECPAGEYVSTEDYEQLQAQVDAAIKWIQHDCPWDEATIREQLQGTTKGDSNGY